MRHALPRNNNNNNNNLRLLRLRQTAQPTWIHLYMLLIYLPRKNERLSWPSCSR